MIKVFISQPMNGKSDEDILNERNCISEYIRKSFKDKEVEILDSYFEDFDDTSLTGANIALKYLAKSIDILAYADLLVLANGWEETRGCVIEEKCARLYGIDVVEMEEMK